MANYNLEVFNNLCDRAKEIVFEAIQKFETSHFLYINGLDDSLIEMTPIEQIFYIASEVYTLNKKEYHFSLIPQYEIKIQKKKYIADFAIQIIDLNEQEITLKKTLLIELDGKQYHSSIQQRNYDYDRENILKLNDYEIMRFTGSQVYNEPYACVKKVDEMIQKLIEV